MQPAPPVTADIPQDVTLRDYKSHRNTLLSLGCLSFFVGPNGSGKTSALEALALQHGGRTDAGAAVLDHLGSRPTIHDVRRALLDARVAGLRWVLVDHIEGELHPLAQMELGHALREALPEFVAAGVRFVATTQSPYMVDAATYEQVHVFYCKDGVSFAASLAAHPKAARYRGCVPAPDLWTEGPESWVVDLVALPDHATHPARGAR